MSKTADLLSLSEFHATLPRARLQSLKAIYTSDSYASEHKGKKVVYMTFTDNTHSYSSDPLPPEDAERLRKQLSRRVARFLGWKLAGN